jgi:dTDP-4-dehydrorhamnose 3,5-epimerase
VIVERLDIPEILLIKPRVFTDARGHFLETWEDGRYRELGIPPFVQDNASRSHRGVIRGLHFQHPNAQGKLITVVHGEAFDVAVDVRTGSPTFRCWVGVTLTGGTCHQLYIPPGFAHGFQALSDDVVLAYKCRTHRALGRSLDRDRMAAWRLGSQTG